MTLPYYASAEQIMRDRSELARKGIGRGRSVIALIYADGGGVRRGEPVEGAAQDQRTVRPGGLRRGR